MLIKKIDYVPIEVMINVVEFAVMFGLRYEQALELSETHYTAMCVAIKGGNPDFGTSPHGLDSLLRSRLIMAYSHS
jgi:hypothetical protein